MTARISPYIVLAPPHGLLPHPPLPPRTARRAARSLPPCGAPYCCAARSRRARTVTVRPPMPMTPIYASRVRCPGSWTERLPATYVCDSASALRAPPRPALSSRPPTAYTDTATYISVFDAQVPTRRATTSTSWLRRTLTAIFSCCPITCISLCFLLPHSRLPRPLAMSIIHRTYAFAVLRILSSQAGLGRARCN